MSNMGQSIRSQLIYKSIGNITQVNSCRGEYISFFVPERQQIQIFDPEKQQVIKGFPLTQRIRDTPMSYHFITNDLRYLILVWEKQQQSEIYKEFSSLLVERFQGKILGPQCGGQITQVYQDQRYFSSDGYKEYILLYDLLRRYPAKYLYFMLDQLSFNSFQKHLLIIVEKLTKLMFINVKHKIMQQKFRIEWSSYPQINFSHNSNYFLFGFKQPSCLIFIVRQTHRFRQIRRITIKSQQYSIQEAGKFLFYHDKNSNFIYQMNVLNFSLTCITRGFPNTLIQCTQDRKYLVCTKKNHIVTFDLSL